MGVGAVGVFDRFLAGAECILDVDEEAAHDGRCLNSLRDEPLDRRLFLPDLYDLPEHAEDVRAGRRHFELPDDVSDGSGRLLTIEECLEVVEVELSGRAKEFV
jgi:hypothetical protein